MIPEKVKALLSRPDYRGLPLTVRHVIKLHCMFTPGNLILRRWNVGADVATGVVGDRGTGKSVSAATIATKDHMMVGEPCWSNLAIRGVLEITDDVEILLREYEEFTGLLIERKPVIYQSQPLDMVLFLSEHPPYHRGVVLIDEINITLADAWRSMTNQALAASDSMQQLRKVQSALLFTCISEMAVPNRIRDGADVYIQTRDMAFINESSYYGQQQGMDYEWKVFPMTGKLAGYANTYAELGRPYQVMRMHGRSSWGLIDTYARQKREKHVSSLYSHPDKDIAADMPVVVENDTVEKDRALWGWMYQHPYIQDMMATESEVERYELLDALRPEAPSGLVDRDIEKHFTDYLNPRYRWSGGHKYYFFSSVLGRKGREREFSAATPI
jgi:hypothetical protein